MPQRKNEVMRLEGAHGLIEAAALEYIRQHLGGAACHESAMDAVISAAVDPGGYFAKHFPSVYAQAPDLFAGLLAHLRDELRKLRRSKAGRLMIYMATNTVMQHPDRGPMMHADFRDCGVKNSGMADCEVARAYEHETGEGVSTADVTKARQSLLAHYHNLDRVRRKRIDPAGKIR